MTSEAPVPTISLEFGDEAEPEDWPDGWRLVELWDHRGRVGRRSFDVERPLAVGRSGDIDLGDASLSRFHCRLHACEDEPWCVLRDLDSRNGTFVNGRRVRHAVLEQGDVIRVGSTICCVDRRTAPPGEVARRFNARACSTLHALRSIDQVVGSGVSVLICGEPGTGKQVLASILHELSGLDGDLVQVNCARLDPAVADSELFGHVRGAFTGAATDRDGLVVQSDGGTLFLDEVAEIPLETQARLLKVVEEQQVRPLGSNRSRRVEFRLICATNSDVERAVSESRFRADLYHRIAEWRVDLPPLRDRVPDIPALLEAAGAPRIPSPRTRELAACSTWPRNVRGLVQAARLLRLPGLGAETARARVFGGHPQRPPPYQPGTERPEDAVSLRKLLAAFDGNISAVARHVGRSRQVVYRWMDRFDAR